MTPSTLPPPVLALPEDIRAAMGEAWATEIVLAIERLAAEGRRQMQTHEENANDVGLEETSKRQTVGRSGVVQSAA